MSKLIECPLTVVDLFLFGNPSGTCWSKVIPDQRGLVNAAKYISKAKLDSEWISGMTGMIKYLPNQEVEDILITGRFDDNKELTALLKLLQHPTQLSMIRSFGKLGDRIGKLNTYKDIDSVLYKTKDMRLLSSIEPTDVGSLVKFLKVTGNYSPIEKIHRYRDLFSYIDDDSIFTTLMENLPCQSHWEKIAMLNYKGIGRFPDVGARCLLELSRHIASSPSILTIPDQVLPKVLFQKLPTNCLLTLFTNSGMVRQMESFPEIKRYTAGWIIKNMGRKEIYELACLRATAVKHTPMQKYRDAVNLIPTKEDWVKNGLITELYMFNHLFIPKSITLFKGFMESPEYQSLPEDLKVSDSALALAKKSMEVTV